MVCNGSCILSREFGHYAGAYLFATVFLLGNTINSKIYKAMLFGGSIFASQYAYKAGKYFQDKVCLLFKSSYKRNKVEYEDHRNELLNQLLNFPDSKKNKIDFID